MNGKVNSHPLLWMETRFSFAQLKSIDYLSCHWCVLPSSFPITVCWHSYRPGREAWRHEGIYHAGASVWVSRKEFSLRSDHKVCVIHLHLKHFLSLGPVVKLPTLKIHSEKDALKFLMESRNGFLWLDSGLLINDEGGREKKMLWCVFWEFFW